MSAPRTTTFVTKVEQDIWDEINSEIKFHLELLIRPPQPEPHVADVLRGIRAAMVGVGKRHGLETR